MSTLTETTTSTVLSGSDNEATYIPRGPTETTLSFFVPPADGSTPYDYVSQPPGDLPRSSYSRKEEKITVQDIRNRESHFHLDQDAFQAYQNIPSSAEPSFKDEENIKSVYYPEVEKLILDKVPGAHRVFIFDHTIRRPGPDSWRGPVHRAHIDQTIAATKARVRHHLPEEAEELLKGRYRIINVWRPLNGPVQSEPLAFASAPSVDDDDLVAVELRYPDRTGETAGVKYNQNQKWYYWSGMQNDERLLLKCADSKDGVGKRVPHSAFSHPGTPENAIPRESIEVRTLVFG